MSSFLVLSGVMPCPGRVISLHSSQPALLVSCRFMSCLASCPLLLSCHPSCVAWFLHVMLRTVSGHASWCVCCLSSCRVMSHIVSSPPRAAACLFRLMSCRLTSPVVSFLFPCLKHIVCHVVPFPVNARGRLCARVSSPLVVCHSSHSWHEFM